MKTKPLAIFLIILCTFLTATGQILLKLSASKLSFHIMELITNYYLIAGFALYGLGALLLIVALKYGELSTLYPFIALGFIWVSIASIIFLSESMSFLKWGGVIFILAGVSLIGKGGK